MQFWGCINQTCPIWSDSGRAQVRKCSKVIDKMKWNCGDTCPVQGLKIKQHLQHVRVNVQCRNTLVPVVLISESLSCQIEHGDSRHSKDNQKYETLKQLLDLIQTSECLIGSSSICLMNKIVQPIFSTFQCKRPKDSGYILRKHSYYVKPNLRALFFCFLFGSLIPRMYTLYHPAIFCVFAISFHNWKNVQKNVHPHLNIFAWQKSSNIFLNIFCHFHGCIWFQPMCSSFCPPSTEKSIPQHGLLPLFISGIPITRRVLTLSSNCEGKYLEPFFLWWLILILANTCCMPWHVPHAHGIVFWLPWITHPAMVDLLPLKQKIG